MFVDVEDKTNHKPYKKIDVGFYTENALKDACAKAQKERSTISDKQLMAFRLLHWNSDENGFEVPTILLPCSKHGGSRSQRDNCQPKHLQREIEKGPNCASQFEQSQG